MERAKVPRLTTGYPINRLFPHTKNKQRKLSKKSISWCPEGKKEGEYANARQLSIRKKEIHDECHRNSIIQINKIALLREIHVDGKNLK